MSQLLMHSAKNALQFENVTVCGGDKAKSISTATREVKGRHINPFGRFPFDGSLRQPLDACLSSARKVVFAAVSHKRLFSRACEPRTTSTVGKMRGHYWTSGAGIDADNHMW
eukprot:5380786-Amphidinium_carterae.1